MTDATDEDGDWRDDPHAPVEAETAVLGACLVDPAACREVLERLTPEDFSHPHLEAVYLAIQSAVDPERRVDATQVMTLLRERGETMAARTFTEKLRDWPTGANVGFYVPRIKHFTRARQEKAIRENLARAGADPVQQDIRRQELELFLADAREGAPRGPQFTPIGAFDLLEKRLPPVEEIVAPRVIYRGGVTVMVASHKRGKSLAALSLCVDLVLNIAAPMLFEHDENAPTWLGQKVIGRGPVLVYSAEGGERMIQERLRRMAPTAGPDMNNLFVYAKKPTPQLDNVKHLDAVFAQAEALGAVMLVFDPLGRFWAMEDEADPTTARNLMEAIQTRAEAAYAGRGIAVLIIHHETKAAGADESSAVTGGRGSGKFGDDADALINLKIVAKGEPGESVAKFLLRHAESPSPVPVKIDKDTLRLIRLAGDAPLPSGPKGGRPPSLSLARLEDLVSRKGHIELARVADELGIPFNTWKNNRRELVRDLIETGHFSVRNIAGTNREEVVHLNGTTTETTETPHAPA